MCRIYPISSRPLATRCKALSVKPCRKRMTRRAQGRNRSRAVPSTQEIRQGNCFPAGIFTEPPGKRALAGLPARRRFANIRDPADPAGFFSMSVCGADAQADTEPVLPPFTRSGGARLTRQSTRPRLPSTRPRVTAACRMAFRKTSIAKTLPCLRRSRAFQDA